MKVFGIICVLAALLPVHPIGADIYRYMDQHGNEIYTDDVNKVPVGQREGARVSDEESPVLPSSGEEKPDAAPVRPSDAKAGDLKKAQVELDILKAKLREEFNALAKENARLKAKQKTAITPDQRKAFNKQVVSFNTRFKAYKEKEAAYKSRLEQHQQRFKAETSNPDRQ